MDVVTSGLEGRGRKELGEVTELTGQSLLLSSTARGLNVAIVGCISQKQLYLKQLEEMILSGFITEKG